MKKTEMNDTTLNISAVNTGFSEIPGRISLNVYLQGCNIGCPGCQNPDLQPLSGGEPIDWFDFLQIIWKHSMCDWLCWLGGEPTCQQKTVTNFNELIKSNSTLKICMYTGTYFNKLPKSLLKYLDLVIDGPWEGKTIKEKDTNQKIYLKQNDKWINVEFSELEKLIKGE